MKPTTINVQITKCPKQFEAVRIGIEAGLDAGETVEGAIKAATAQLNALYVEMYQPKQEKPVDTPKTGKETETDTRELLTFEDKRLQAIITRIEKAGSDKKKVAEIVANVNKYYKPDANAQKAIDVAIQLLTK